MGPASFLCSPPATSPSQFWTNASLGTMLPSSLSALSLAVLHAFPATSVFRCYCCIFLKFCSCTCKLKVTTPKEASHLVGKGCPYFPSHGTILCTLVPVEVCYCRTVSARVPTAPEGVGDGCLSLVMSLFLFCPPAADLTTLVLGLGGNPPGGDN